MAIAQCKGLQHYLQKFKFDQTVFKYFNFHTFLILTVTGMLLVLEGPVSNFVFSTLPVFNRITILPAFVIFLLIPYIIVIGYGTNFLYNLFNLAAEKAKLTKKIKNKRVITDFIFLGISFAIFSEVLLGPSVFGSNTYTYNFPKIDYIKELYSFPHYEILKKQEPGLMVATMSPDLFTYSYGVENTNLFSLHAYRAKSNGYWFI